MFSLHLSETKGESFPPLNFIWIGSPSKIPGHDIAGVIHMAAANKSNEIIFWCLEKYETYYRERLADYPVKICAIQPFLQPEHFEDCFIKQAVTNLNTIGAKILGWGKDADTFQRGLVRDYVTFKEVFSLLLLVLGGYTLDTNVRPEASVSTISLPHYKTFRMVKLPEQIDCWMLYAPQDSRRARLVLNDYFYHWNKIEKSFKKNGGYTKEYYDAIGSIMLSALSAPAKPKCLYWSATDITGTLCTIKELHIEKRYYNTHRFENRVSHDSSAKGQSTHGKLFHAIKEGNVGWLKELVSYGADVNQKISDDSSECVTPMHVAVYAGSHESLKVLLDNDADLTISATFQQGRAILTPHQLAEKLGDRKACTMIEEHKGTPRTTK